MGCIRDLETNLYSREFFDEELERLSKKRDANIGTVVIEIETDNPQIILKTAEILQNLVRAYDIVGRVNPNEFGIILENVTEDNIIEITKRIASDLKNAFASNATPPKVNIAWNISKSFFGDLKQAYEELRKRRENS
jgi:GGDEF domain-containing protein